MRARAKELFAVLLVGVPLIMISIAYWDRPLAQWSATHELHFRGRTLLTSVPSAALPVALAVPFLGMFATPRLLASQLWTMLNRLAVSVLWTAAVIELVLKCAFGRLPPQAWVQGHAFGFHWFKGTDIQMRSFPSGEAGLAMAVVSILWLNYPRLRVLLALAAALEAFLLVDLQWHFLGDVLAGGFVGMLGGLIAQQGGHSVPLKPARTKRVAELCEYS